MKSTKGLLAVLMALVLLALAVVPVMAQGTGEGVPWPPNQHNEMGHGTAYWYPGEQGDVSVKAVIVIPREDTYDRWVGAYSVGIHTVYVNGVFYKIVVADGEQEPLSVYYEVYTLRQDRYYR